jgi:hypothetical protein
MDTRTQVFLFVADLESRCPHVGIKLERDEPVHRINRQEKGRTH